MNDIEQILNKTFEKKILDNDSKKRIKKIAKAQSLDNGELNILVKKAFEMFKTGIKNDDNLFLVDWLQTVVNIVNDLKSDINTVTDVQFSPINDCRETIIDFIKSANKSLYICVFTISDNDISKEILLKHKQGLDIRIITDNEKQFDMGSDVQELQDAGIKVKMDESRHHMHHKFAIADKKDLLTGSYNWTRSAALYNQENLLVMNDSFALKKYLNEFYRLWKTSVMLN